LVVGLSALAVLVVTGLVSLSAQAQETVFTLTIKDHRFEPTRLEVPANVKFKLVVRNLDNERAEFESKPMKVEKIIPGNAETTLNVGPLKPGEYPFVEEFHEDVANGVIVAR